MSSSRPSRAGRKTRPLYTSITGTQPSRYVDVGAESGADMHPGSSSGAGTTTSSPTDSEGTIDAVVHHMRMKREYDDVGTSVDEPPQWVDDRSSSKFSVYKTAVSEEGTDPIPFKPKVWKEITLEGRQKSGDIVFGIGDHGLQCSSSTGRSHAICSDAQQRIEILEARLVEEQRLAAEFREQSERQFAEIMAVMQSMAQRMHGSSNTPPPPPPPPPPPL